MKKTILIGTTIVVLLSACKNRLEKWITFNDEFNIGSISLPSYPNLYADTAFEQNYAIVKIAYISSLETEEKGPSAFSYTIFSFLGDGINLVEKKKDSTKLNALFNNMINGALFKANATLTEKVPFNYPEPGMKFTLSNNINGSIAVCRLVIFDNYIILTSANGKKEDFSYELEEDFFETLKINSEKR